MKYLLLYSISLGKDMHNFTFLQQDNYSVYTNINKSIIKKNKKGKVLLLSPTTILVLKVFSYFRCVWIIHIAKPKY